MDLSIVIPAFNERPKIARDVEAAAAFLSEQRLTGQIIVVDDGSTDGTAEAAESAPIAGGVERRVIRMAGNVGKGGAVRAGMLATRGDCAMFADSGLCVPYDNALRGLSLLRSSRCEIAHGSRWLASSVIVRPKGLSRRLMTATFRRLAPVVTAVPRRLSDTQCGFKLYRGDVARALYARCVCEGFLFDVEVVLRAVRRGWRIEEFPVEWRSDPDSRLRLVRHLPGLVGQLRTIRRALAGR